MDSFKQVTDQQLILVIADRFGEGAAAIMKERARQKTEEGYGEAHDDEHWNDAISVAAACYLLPQPARDLIYAHPEGKRNTVPSKWPWPADQWKPEAADYNCHQSQNPAIVKRRIREIEKGGALAAAEIDRLKRLIESTEDSGGE